MKLEGHTVFITDGTSGLGFALAQRLSEKNQVIVCSKEATELARIKNSYPHIKVIGADLGDKEVVARLAERLKAENVSILINNGTAASEPDLCSSDFSVHLERFFRIYTLAPFRLTTLILDQLERLDGAVVMISTPLVMKPSEEYPAYSAVKAASSRLTSFLRSDAKVPIFEVTPPFVDAPLASLDEGIMNPEDCARIIVNSMEKDKLDIKPGSSFLDKLLG